MSTPSTPAPSDFIRRIVAKDVKNDKHGGRVITRFPPEPNGYLHIGHAKSICLNFGVALEYGGKCNLRFDDTNPEKEDPEYVQAIQDDIRWMGFAWAGDPCHASDYQEQLYQFALQLIEGDKAYVDSLSQEEIRLHRGTLTEPGRVSPYRDRSIEENLDLFGRMRAGEFPDGAHILRAKIDMASPKVIMRDPTLYRIRHAEHYRTGDAWCIYPTYDYAHCLSDYIEGVTHSLCTLEFENNRAVYDWVLDTLGLDPRPEQTEFARLNLSYTVLSKRKLLQLVEEGYVNGWNDPRMPTLSGLRRRGYTPEAIRSFCDQIGVARRDNTVDIAHLEHSIRDDLNRRAPRAMAVLRPLKLVIDNYPDTLVEEMEAANNPEDPSMGTRMVPFSRELYIEQEDFREDPAQELLPAGPRQGGTPAVRLPRHLRGCGEELIGASHRGPLHLRPRYPGRDCPRRTQGAGNDSLGVGPALGAGRGEALRQAIPAPRAGQGRRGRGLHQLPEPGVHGNTGRLPGRAELGRGSTRGQVPVRAPGLLLRRH